MRKEYQPNEQQKLKQKGLPYSQISNNIDNHNPKFPKHFNPSKNQDYYHQSLKLNQHLLTQTSFLLLLLSFISIINNGSRSYDYNIVIAGGIYFLSTVNPFLYKMLYFYFLVGFTIFADGIIIGLLIGKVSIFHSVIFPAIEIVVKILILVFQGLRWLKQTKQTKAQQQKGLTKQQIKQMKKVKSQLQKQQKLQEDRLKSYFQSKRPKVLDRSNYYNPININPSYKPNYSAQEYKQFYNLQFGSSMDETQRQKKR